MLQVLLSGLASGAIYGLVGMGFAIAFYVTRVINFAQGQLLMGIYAGRSYSSAHEFRSGFPARFPTWE